MLSRVVVRLPPTGGFRLAEVHRRTTSWPAVQVFAINEGHRPRRCSVRSAKLAQVLLPQFPLPMSAFGRSN